MAERAKKGKTFKLEIITPERLVVEEEVEAVVIPAAQGFLGILRNHAPFLGGLEIGVIKYRREGKFHWVACSTGVFEVKENTLRILADTAERGEDINVLRAQQARDRALRRLREKETDLDYVRAELALRRALARLKAAAYEAKDPL
ncbi:MAG: F0F1 ATP synthase subunit epsilon [Firmicutes bacterium]|nr:F0F1 ATP synthase subunit epsilon [Bacillota bacterium]